MFNTTTFRLVAAALAISTVAIHSNQASAASLSVQAQVTKKLQVKFGLTHLNASSTELKGENVVIGLNPVWQPSWNGE